MHRQPFSFRIHRLSLAATTAFAGCLLLSASLFAQGGQTQNGQTQNSGQNSNDGDIYGDNNTHTPDNGNRDNTPRYNPRDNDAPADRDMRNTDPGVTAGGNWHEYDTEDKMTAAKRVKFELVSDNSLRQNRDAQSRIEIYCESGKYHAAEFVPGVRLARPNRPGFWGQPQMEVMVRVDGQHDNHGWNWNGRFLSMDKGTTRELLGAKVFKIEFLGPRGPEIAEFTPSGLDLSRIAQGCALTPKKP